METKDEKENEMLRTINRIKRYMLDDDKQKTFMDWLNVHRDADKLTALARACEIATGVSVGEVNRLANDMRRIFDVISISLQNKRLLSLIEICALIIFAEEKATELETLRTKRGAFAPNIEYLENIVGKANAAVKKNNERVRNSYIFMWCATGEKSPSEMLIGIDSFAEDVSQITLSMQYKLKNIESIMATLHDKAKKRKSLEDAFCTLDKLFKESETKA